MPDQNQSPQTTASPSAPIAIDQALHVARQDASYESAAFVAITEEQKKRELIAKLRVAIANSLFLEEQRKQMWINALHLLDLAQAEELLGAILRENLRYKKNIRKLKFKEIPERVAEEGGEI